MAWLTAGCVRRSLRAAREKLRSAATVTKTRRSSKVITISRILLMLNIITLTLDRGPRRLRGMSSKLIVFDTTLRDGEQAPGFSMRVDEKVRMARAARGPGRRHRRGRVPDRVGSRRRGGAARRRSRWSGRSWQRWRAARRRTSTARRGRSRPPAGGASTRSSRRPTCTSSASSG